jgi:hypothetical protein
MTLVIPLGAAALVWGYRSLSSVRR